MCDLISDVITCVFEAGIWVKSRHQIKSCLKTRTKRENMEIKDIFKLNPHVKDCLNIEFAACKGELMTEKALTSFAVSDAYH